MADQKISQLNDNDPIQGSEYLPIVQPVGVPRSNKKISIDELMEFAPVQSVNGQQGEVELVASDVGALASGDNISLLVNDAGYVTSAGSLFVSNITVSLPAGRFLGPYQNGDVIPSLGKTPEEFANLIARTYVVPFFTSFTLTGQATTEEVGITLSTPATVSWAITVNSGVVSSIDIYDVTGSNVLVASTPNDGVQVTALGAIQLNSNGATRVYRGTLHDTGTSPSDINSSNFTITARYKRFWAPTASTPVNSAAIRALANSAFQTASNSFTLATGTTLIQFSVYLPPGVTIVSVTDTTNLNADLTSDGINGYLLLGTKTVVDIGGTSRTYNEYQLNIATPYPVSANHVILTT